MGRAFYDTSPDIQALYKHANRLLGYDLMALCFEGDPEELKRTDRCQPAIYLTSIAAWTAWRLRVAGKPMPQATCGLSLGEYAALTAAEVIGFEEGLKLVQTRGEAMERASAQGLIYVIKLNCDAYAFEYATLKERFDRWKLPHLKIEAEATPASIEQLNVRVQSFVESLL